MKELSISCPKSRRHKFIQSTRSTPQSWRVNLSPTQLDAFLQPIFLLRLDGIFARWDSHAYQGLTHLRLDGGSIKEKDLINVLTRNPRLRYFYFNLRIWDRKLRKAPPTPAKLPDLEVLDLDTMDNTDLWSLLRLLVPGSVPLGIGLAITDLDYLHDFAETPEVQAFFQRSNITTCYFSAYGKFQVAWFPNILHRLADLRRLCLRNYSYLGRDSSTKPDDIKLCSQLSELMMIDCKLDLDEFKDLLRVHNIQILRLWDCTVFRRGDKLDAGTKELNEELSELVADTKCYQGNDDMDSDPHMSWRFIKR
ncbi:hypothetical protein FRC09_005374 [Ceratobasidium sp. 395]|nr:hypothetical protein FRC09_005374 [Ceratobasidium sp. 395]